MEFRQLRSFVEAARLCHFTRAAERLHIAQPALSQQISTLERELGVKLFDRRGRRVTLTPPGARLLDSAEPILAAVERLRAELAGASGEPSGATSVGSLSTLVAFFLPRELPRLHRQFANVDVAIREETTTQLRHLLRAGEIEIALGDQHLDDGSIALAQRPLFDEEVVLALPRLHPLARKKAVGFEDLAGERFVSFKEGSAIRDTLFALSRVSGFEPHVAYECVNPSEFVAHGLGVALLPRQAAEALGERARVHSLHPPQRRSIGLFRVRDRHLSSAGQAFWDFQWTTPENCSGGAHRSSSSERVTGFEPV